MKMLDMEDFAKLNTGMTPASICAWVAQLFNARDTEVGLLKLNGTLLHFLHPAAGAIPLASSSVAARTARTQQANIFNNFAKVDHFSVLELVKLGDSGEAGGSGSCSKGTGGGDIGSPRFSCRISQATASPAWCCPNLNFRKFPDPWT